VDKPPEKCQPFVDYERPRAYKKIEETINNELVFSNLDMILKQPRRILLEWHLKSIYHAEISNDGNLITGKTFSTKRGSPEYERMITKSLEQVREHAQAALKQAIERKKDPKDISSVDSLAISFNKRMKEIDSKYSLSNLPNILKRPEKAFLMVSVFSLFQGKIEDNGDLTIQNRTIRK
jgi:hypothetical protein